jgi:transposase-like protein
LSARRDVAAAKAFFRKAVKSQQRLPQTITLDGYAASHRAARVLGFKKFCNAATPIAGIELMHRIRKGQFGLRHRGIHRGAVSAIWNRVLEA